MACLEGVEAGWPGVRDSEATLHLASQSMTESPYTDR